MDGGRYEGSSGCFVSRCSNVNVYGDKLMATLNVQVQRGKMGYGLKLFMRCNEGNEENVTSLASKIPVQTYAILCDTGKVF